MNGRDYRDWMLRAFCATQGRLLAEISKKFSYVSEEKVRMAFMEGLVLAEPSEAHRVKEEQVVSWSTAPCWHDALHGEASGAGRRIQHDVWIDPKNEGEPALACELKWLKQRKPLEIAKDVWKLALSRGTTSERDALRTYLLVGGEKEVFAPTLASVRDKHIDLKWSRRGSRSSGSLPPPRKFSLKRVLDSGGDQSFSKLCRWGANPSHMRCPPDCKDQLRLTCVESWEKVVGARGWRLALWEIDAFSCKGAMDWKGYKASVQFKCPPPVAAK